MGEPLRVEDLKGIFANMTDEEHNAVMEELIRDGIMDREGNVLVRMPEGPPEWAQPANEQPAATKNGKPSRKRRR